MDQTEKLSIDVYPWAAPTVEQKAMFDALPLDAKRRMIANAIEDGFNSGVSDKTIEEILAEAGAENRHAS